LYEELIQRLTETALNKERPICYQNNILLLDTAIWTKKEPINAKFEENCK
jgi:hypothetical protein